MNVKRDLEIIREALFTGQISAVKVDAQRAFQRLTERADLSVVEIEEQLEADARALWAVKVLDAYEEKNAYAELPRPRRLRSGLFYVSGVAGEFKTQAEAREAMAKALVAAHPELDPDAPRAEPPCGCNEYGVCGRCGPDAPRGAPEASDAQRMASVFVRDWNKPRGTPCCHHTPAEHEGGFCTKCECGGYLDAREGLK